MIFKKPLRIHPYICPSFAENALFFLKSNFSFLTVVQNGNNCIIFYSNNKRCILRITVMERFCHVLFCYFGIKYMKKKKSLIKMVDTNFLNYLKKLGFVPTDRHEEYIDVIVSVASDKTTVEKKNNSLNNNISTSGGSIPKQTLRRMTTRSKTTAKRSKDKEKSDLRLVLKSPEQKRSRQNAETKTTSLLHTSSVNSSYHPSLSQTQPKMPINISNKYFISCYMDSVIQCLYWTPRFTEMLLNASPAREDKNIYEYWDPRYIFNRFKDHSRKSDEKLAQEFRNVIQCYSNNEITLVEKHTDKLIQDLNTFFIKKRGIGGQQDSGEFLLSLFDILSNTYHQKNAVERRIQVDSFIQELFEFTVKREDTCVYCNNLSYTVEPEKIIKLGFDKMRVDDSYSFNNLLHNFFEENIGKDCYNSDECMQKTEALYKFYTEKQGDRPDIQQHDGRLLHRRQVKIREAAQNLIILFKRFEKTAGGTSSTKIDTNVTGIPFELNLNPYTDSNKDTKYDLYAFIHHWGGLSAGHYINFVKIEKQWWFVDDKGKAPIKVRPESKSFSTYLAESYILFYTKKE